MATRSTITLYDEGVYKTIYCHFDGYPSHVGRILNSHYNTIDKVRELIALGDLSSLYENLGPQLGEQHSFDTPAKNVTVAYHRDRGEDWEETEPIVYHTQKEIERQEYNYLFKNDKWKCI